MESKRLGMLLDQASSPPKGGLWWINIAQAMLEAMMYATASQLVGWDRRHCSLVRETDKDTDNSILQVNVMTEW